MASQPPKIAFIESGNSHSECVESLIQYAQVSGLDHFLICSEQLANRLPKQLMSSVEIITFPTIGKYLRKARWVRKTLKLKKVTCVVFTTAQGKLCMHIASFLPRQIYSIGILHNLRKLKGSFSQRLIFRNLHHCWVLSDFLLDKNRATLPSKPTFSALYTLPSINVATDKFTINKPNNEIWIVIPGQVEFKRRDYHWLLQEADLRQFPDNIKFIFLGPSEHSHGDGAEIKQKISQFKLEKRFVLWPDFIDTNTFKQYLKLADYILPLIHPDKPGFDNYSQFQLSGAFNLSYGLKIPLLMDKYFQGHPDFDAASIFYNAQLGLAELFITLNGKKKVDFNLDKWTVAFQSMRFTHQITNTL